MSGLGQDFNQRKLFLTLLGFIVLIAGMGISLRTQAGQNWLGQMISDTVNGTERLWFKPIFAVYETVQEVSRMRTLDEENAILRQTLAQYAKDAARLNDLEAQNLRLKTALDFTERQKQLNNYIYRIAEVIAGSPDLYHNHIIINLGSKDGVRVNMAVTTVDGLLGRIIGVSPFTSTVQMLTEMDNQSTTKGIAATVKGKESASFGLVEGYDRTTNRLIMTKIDPSDPIQPGDEIVTSGLGDVFPRGLVVGTLENKTIDEFGLTYRALVKPNQDFRRIHEVFVVEVPEMR